MKKRVKVDVQMVREYLNVITSFIAGNSNPAVVTLAAVIFNYKIVFKQVTEKDLTFEVNQTLQKQIKAVFC